VIARLGRCCAIGVCLLPAAIGAQDFPMESPSAPVRAAAAPPAATETVGPDLVVPFNLLGRFVLPGTRAVLDWQATGSVAGNDSSSPVSVVHGARPGPVLCLAAGIHGDEINGVEIVRQVMNALQPERVSGTVVGVPVVNLFGFQRGSRYLPDRRDLNRFFPGTRYGSIASRIAHDFFDGIVRHCDALVDFHTGSFDRSNLPQVRADLRLPAVLALSRNLGATVVLHTPGSKGMLRLAATDAGIPAFTFEVGAPARLQTAEIATAVAAIARLLHGMGITEGDPGADEPQPIFYESQWVRANGGGLLISEVELGQRVQKGQRLGRVVDPLHNTERSILSPLFGRVLGMAQNQQVLPGFAAFHLGEETSEQRAVQEAAAIRDPETAADEDGGRAGTAPEAPKPEADEEIE